MTDERWRCFVAIPIGEELRDDLRKAVDGWRSREDVAALRWTDPEGWHLTLAFLGSIDPASVPGVVEDLATIAEAHPATRSATGGLGAFPTPARARVAWYGIEDAHGRLARLAADVAVALGLDTSRPNRPHLTLARARREPVDLRSWLASASAPKGVLAAVRIELMRSHIGRGPARYETLAAITLGVPAGV
jgi:RNA 2',3'-cyclic 3'-phosphodiesterase